jgi:hypothetical protein
MARIKSINNTDVAEVTLPHQPTKGTGIVSFSGHETFTLRHGWLKKAVDEIRANPRLFADEDAMVGLGVGKNMVRSIRHWALATDTLAELPNTRGTELCSTDFGDLIFGAQGRDPFLEDLNTLWLLHWKLAINERRSTGWCWMFNLLRTDEFTRDSLAELFQAELKRRNIAGPSASSLGRDIDCALRTYLGTRAKADLLEDNLECPLVELQLITVDPEGVLFRFNRAPKPSISDEVFLYCLLEFWDWRTPGDTLSFSDIAFEARSPGSVFKLDENSTASRLERLDHLTAGNYIYDETSGLKQVYRRTKMEKNTVLERYYKSILTNFGDGNAA